MTLVLFDGLKRENFWPLSLTRALCDIKIGCKSNFENIDSLPIKILTAGYLEDITKIRHGYARVNDFEYDPDDLYLNSMFLIHDRELKKLYSKTGPFVLIYRNNILAAKLGYDDSEHVTECVVNGKDIIIQDLRADKTKIETFGNLGNFYENIWN